MQPHKIDHETEDARRWIGSRRQMLGNLYDMLEHVVGLDGERGA